jgi:membrane fusion protein, macrolide-specific efflux system
MSRSAERGSLRWILAAGLAVAVLAGAGYRFYAAQGSRPRFREVIVKRGELRVSILSTGIVQPENRVEIKPPIAGRLEEVLVSEGSRVRKGQILAWMSSTERAALLDAASARGEKELKEWGKMYRPTPILAPISGTIIARNFEGGQTFATTDAILVMSDRLTVKAQVDETDVGAIKLKQRATIVLDAYPAKMFEARVDQIAFEAKTVNSVTTYVVDVLPDETPEFMRSGMTANVSFEVASKQDALLVPAEAVKVGGGESSVLVPAPGGRGAVEQGIQTGLTDGKQAEVVSGLEEGSVVLIPERQEGARKQGTSPLAPMAPGGGRGGRGGR